MHKLIIEDDEGRTTVVPLIRDEMTIGRQEGNTIRLTERNISRRHARLVARNGSIVIEDLSSFNGVKVNGARIRAATPVREGDLVLLGDYKFSIKADRASAAVPAVGAAPPRTTAPQILAAPSAAMAPPAMAAPQPVAAAPAPMPAQPAPDVPQMDGAPTIPIRTLAAQGMVNPETGALIQPSRLVVLNTDFRGAEFVVDRASVVIGRTDENDFVINHRSISRHHAKIVRDGNRYTILDLESANGVRVNGEEYERVELHPGDNVELGHVRLRFLAAGDVFSPDDLGGPGRRYLKPALFGAGLVVAGVIGATFLLRPSQRTVVAVAPTAVPAGAPSGATPAPAPTAAQAPSDEDLIAQLGAARKAESWTSAQTALDQLAARHPNDERIIGLKRQVEGERASADALSALKLAFDQRNDDQVVQLYDAMPDGPHKERAREIYEKARSHAVAFHIQTAEHLRGQGKCADVTQEAKVVLAMEPDNQLIRQVVKMCKPARGEVVAARLPEPAPSPRRAAPEPAPVAKAASKRVPAAAAPTPTPTPAAIPARKPEPAPAAAEPAADPDALIKQARDAWLHQRCPAAIDLAKKALKAAGGGLDEAYKIIAVCSCTLSDSDGAARAYGKLGDKDQSMVKSLCAKRGVNLD